MKCVPKSGTASEVGGDMSDTTLRKKHIDKSTVISVNRNFSFIIFYMKIFIENFIPNINTWKLTFTKILHFSFYSPTWNSFIQLRRKEPNYYINYCLTKVGLNFLNSIIISCCWYLGSNFRGRWIATCVTILNLFLSFSRICITDEMSSSKYQWLFKEKFEGIVIDV